MAERRAPARRRHGAGADLRGTSRQAIRRDRQAVARRRRTRLLVVGSVALATLVLVAWFPFGALLHQRSALAATTDQLQRLQRQDRALTAEQAQLSNPAEITRIARQQYQLVAPGQRAYAVLPPAGTTASPNDPGLQPLANPAGSPVDTPDPATTAPSGSTGSDRATTASRVATHRSGPASGFLARVEATLEFWH